MHKNENRVKSLLLTIILISLSLYFIPFNKILKNIQSNPDIIPSFPMTDSSEGTSNEGTQFAINSVTPEATAVGIAVLEAGGNAVDAAIAVSYMLAVTDPKSNGIGGGGVMVIYNPETNETLSYDYYSSTGYEKSKYEIGIPGLVKGLEKLYNDFGSVPFSDLINPAIEAAKNGFEVTEMYANHLQRYPYLFQVNSAFNHNGSVPQEGETIVQTELADLLSQIRDQGSDYIYGGESSFSQSLMNLTGLSAHSLRDYDVQIKPAVHSNYGSSTIFAAPSPFSGSTTIQMIKMADQLQLRQIETADDVLNYHRIMQIAYPENYALIGDSGLLIDENDIVSDEYIKSMLSRESVNSYFEISEKISTTSFSIIDKNGLTISATHTLSNLYGSLNVIEGVFLNNSLSNFSRSEANTYAPMKRPKSFISPTIIVDNGNIKALGSAGGQNIPQIVLQQILHNANETLTIQQSLDISRFVWNKGIFEIEINEDTDYYVELFSSSNVKYKKLTPATVVGISSFVQLKDGVYETGTDYRGSANRSSYALNSK